MKTVKKTPGWLFRILNTEGKKTAQKVLLCLLLFGIMTAAGICLSIISLYFSAGLYSKELLAYYLEQPLLVLLNTLPYLVLCYLFWAITNRAWIGFAVGGVACLLYSFAEYWKLLSRDDPVYAEDLAIMKEALQMSENYIKVTPVMILAVCAVLGGVIFLFLLFRKTKVFSWASRAIISCMILVLCSGLYMSVYTSTDVYNSFVVWEPLNMWFDNNKYISRGGIYPFIYSIQSALPKAPEGYASDTAEEMLLEYETDVIPLDKQANVIIVMYEAFADLSEDTTLITQGDPYEAYHQLKDESYSGKLVTNVFAGGTINTERTVLTGFTEITSFRRASWSYARYFAEQGYRLNGSHAGYQAFYNRLNVNQNLGFDQYYFIENYYNQFTGGIPTDGELLSEIARICLEDIEQGNKVFSFNVTYQNHGPYHTEMLGSSTVYIPEDVISPADHAIANNYLSGVADTGAQMLAMADTFRDLDEPVILAFFGDHKPWLGDSSSTYAALGIDIISENDESFYNHYETDYLIWANDAAREQLGNDFVGEGPVISPCFLMNVLFEQCGWEGPSYQKFTDEVMAALPVITTNDRFQEGDGLVSEDVLSPESQALLQKMRQIQYYLARDAGGALPDAS